MVTRRKRILVTNSFSNYQKMYLGAHMVNDINWGRVERERNNNVYNVVFPQNLALVATRDIELGEELFVNYKYNGGALI